MSRVAVGSADGVTINQHFANAEQFYIYEYNDSGEYSLLEIRKSSLPDNSADKIHAYLEILADVKAVFISSIGPHAFQILQRQGIMPVVLDIAIAKALKAYGQRGKFLESSFAEDVFWPREGKYFNNTCPLRELKMLRNL